MSIPTGIDYRQQKTYTTFLAVPLSAPNVEYISELQRKLLKNGHKEFIWELPEKFHITLLYLGRIPQSKQEHVLKRTYDLFSSMPSFEAQLGHIDYFYNKHSDSVIWLAIYDKQSLLVQMHKELVRSLNQDNFSLSEKKLVPHVTIGRLKKVREEQKKQYLNDISEFEISTYPSVAVNKIQLLYSAYQQHIDTSMYDVIGEVELLPSSDFASD